MRDGRESDGFRAQPARTRARDQVAINHALDRKLKDLDERRSGAAALQSSPASHRGWQIKYGRYYGRGHRPQRLKQSPLDAAMPRHHIVRQSCTLQPFFFAWDTLLSVL